MENRLASVSHVEVFYYTFGLPGSGEMDIGLSDWELTAAEGDSLSVSVLVKDCEEVIPKDP